PHLVRGELKGFQPAERTITIENGTTTRVDLTLQPLPRRVVVIPSIQAQCTLDGGAPQDRHPDNPITFAAPLGLPPPARSRAGDAVEAYQRCVDAGVCSGPETEKESCNWGRRPDHPVNCVDWNQATEYCRWAGGVLPSAEEWEYAAKSGDPLQYPWGADAPKA